MKVLGGGVCGVCKSNLSKKSIEVGRATSTVSCLPNHSTEFNEKCHVDYLTLNEGLRAKHKIVQLKNGANTG